MDNYFLKYEPEVNTLMKIFGRTFFVSIITFIVSFFVDSRLIHIGFLVFSIMALCISVFFISLLARYLYKNKEFHIKCLAKIQNESAENYVHFVKKISSTKNYPFHNILNAIIDKKYIATTTYNRFYKK